MARYANVEDFETLKRNRSERREGNRRKRGEIPYESSVYHELNKKKDVVENLIIQRKKNLHTRITKLKNKNRIKKKNKRKKSQLRI